MNKIQNRWRASMCQSSDDRLKFEVSIYIVNETFRFQNDSFNRQSIIEVIKMYMDILDINRRPTDQDQSPV